MGTHDTIHVSVRLPQAGEPIPDFTLPATHGGTVQLASELKPVALVFLFLRFLPHDLRVTHTAAPPLLDNRAVRPTQAGARPPD